MAPYIHALPPSCTLTNAAIIVLLTDVFLESPLGDRRRIDVEAGSTVIEVKRDLRRERIRLEAEIQLAGYVEFRMNQTGLRYVGILTDGTEWRCYDLVNSALRQVSPPLSLEDSVSDVQSLIINASEIVAHAVLGLPVATLAPTTILSGEKFDEAGT
jgi:hypothetical protein